MDYFLYVGILAAVYAVVAVSYNLMIGHAGLFSIAHAGFFGAGAYVVAITAKTYGLNFVAALLLAAVIGAALATALGLVSLRVSDAHLAIASFAFQMMVVAVLLNWVSLTKGPFGISGIPRPQLFGWKLSSSMPLLALALVVLGISLWLAFRVEHSPFGRILRALREDEVAVRAMGVDIRAVKLSVVALSGAIAASAGGLYAYFVSYVDPYNFTVHESIYMLAMVIIGGAGNPWGSVLGAFVLVTIPQALTFLGLPSGVAGPLRQIFYGGLLLFMLLMRREGLLPERTRKEFQGSGDGAPALPPEEPADQDRVAVVRLPVDAPALEVRGLNKSFGGIRACSELSFSLHRGRITGIIGPNGAGKTTFFNLATGFLKPDSGVVVLNGREITGMEPSRVCRLGMARSFQNLRLFHRMTVLENVLMAVPHPVGDQLLGAIFRPRQAAREERSALAKAMGHLRTVGLEEKWNVRAGSISFAEQKLLSIARLLAADVEVLLLDEPTCGTDAVTLERTSTVLRQIAGEGRTVCIIEHNAELIRQLSDHLIFLHQGALLAEGNPEEIVNDPGLAEVYFGVRVSG